MVSPSAGQFRITLPLKLIESRGWEGIRYILLEDNHPDGVLMRGFIDEEALKGRDDGRPPNVDRSPGGGHPSPDRSGED